MGGSSWITRTKSLLRSLTGSVEEQANSTAGTAGGDHVKPLEPPKSESSADRWRRGVQQIRNTCDWLVRSMTVVALAAVGSGAILSFERAQTWMRLGWLIWGLATTVVGALVVMWMAISVKLPISESAAALVKPYPYTLRAIADQIEESRRKQGEASVTDDLKRYHQANELLVSTRERAAAIAGSSDPKDMQRRAQCEAYVQHYGAVVQETEDRIRDSLGRALYLSMRARFFGRLQWIFAGALMVAIGFPTYFAASRLETLGEASESTGTSPFLVSTGTLTFTDGPWHSVIPGCTDRSQLPILLLGGTGSQQDPWKVRVLPSENCPSAFDVSVGRDQAVLRFDAPNEGLTQLIKEATQSEPKISQPEQLIEILRGTQTPTQAEAASLFVWLLTLECFVWLVWLAVIAKDEEQPGPMPQKGWRIHTLGSQ